MVPKSYLFRAREEDMGGEPGIDGLLGDWRTQVGRKGSLCLSPTQVYPYSTPLPPSSHPVGWPAMNFPSIASGVAISPWHSGFLFHFPVYSGP